jgi:hypothetical protein
MPGDRAVGGVFLWLPFFAQAKKVTRSPTGRVEALHSKERTKEKKKTQDSGVRRNDEKNLTGPIPTQPSP